MTFYRVPQSRLTLLHRFLFALVAVTLPLNYLSANSENLQCKTAELQNIFSSCSFTKLVEAYIR